MGMSVCLRLKYMQQISVDILFSVLLRHWLGDRMDIWPVKELTQIRFTIEDWSNME